MRYLLRPLVSLGAALENIAEGEGDLTRRLPVTSQDEFGRLANAFNQFVQRIHESISQVASTSSTLHDVARQVVDASNANMASSDEQSSRTNSVAAAINELGAAAQEIARNAADASAQASQARQGAELPEGLRERRQLVVREHQLLQSRQLACGVANKTSCHRLVSKVPHRH